MPPAAVPTCLVFSGPDAFRRRAALDTALDTALPVADRDFNYTQLTGRQLTPDVLTTAMETPPCFAERRVVHLTDADQLSAAAVSALTGALDRLSGWGDGALVLLVDYPGDKKPAKEVLARATRHEQFAAMKRRDALDWVRAYARARHGHALAHDVADRLVLTVGWEQAGPLAQEVDKLQMLAGARAITSADIALATGQRVGESTFDLYDAVGTRAYAAAHRALQSLLRSPAYPGVRLAVGLSLHLTQVGVAAAMLANGAPRANVVRRFGGWLGEKYVAQAAHWPVADLDAALVALADADTALKRGADAPRTLEHWLALALLPSSGAR